VQETLFDRILPAAAIGCATDAGNFAVLLGTTVMTFGAHEK
jgi:hypothetical protein